MNIERELTILKNIVRVGTVSSVDIENMTARVTFNDKKDADGQPLVSGHLKVIQNTVPLWLPCIGQLALCIYLPNGESDGFVIGGL